VTPGVTGRSQGQVRTYSCRGAPGQRHWATCKTDRTTTYEAQGGVQHTHEMQTLRKLCPDIHGRHQATPNKQGLRNNEGPASRKGHRLLSEVAHCFAHRNWGKHVPRISIAPAKLKCVLISVLCTPPYVAHLLLFPFLPTARQL
jgi:hypothetical protein